MKRRSCCKLLAAGAIGSVTLGTEALAEEREDFARVTTRGHFELTEDGVVLTEGNTETNYETVGEIPGFDTESPDELVVFIHGYNNDLETAERFTNLTAAALDANGYSQPVVGYTWDAVPKSEDDRVAFLTANEIAFRNGPKLARFLAEYKLFNRKTDVRLVPFSLGAQVALRALPQLDYQFFQNLVTSVSLLGAAVNNDVVHPSTDVGQGIRHVTERTDNFYKRDDEVLTLLSQAEDGFEPLGQFGAAGATPDNYTDHDVTDEVEGHETYFVEDLGAIDDVVATW